MLKSFNFEFKLPINYLDRLVSIDHHNIKVSYDRHNQFHKKIEM